MMDIVSRAAELGFERYGAITPDMVVTSELLAASCTPQSCPKYGSCWSCPPGAGSFEERQAHFEGKNAGILVQTVREGIDFYEDFELLGEIRAVHHERLDALANELRGEFADVLEFSTGGCDICGTCSYPDAPCKQPDKQRLSLSAHGVAVETTCKKANVEYSFENGRIRYVGMILYYDEAAAETAGR